MMPATALPDILPTHTAFDDVCDFFALLDYQLEHIDQRYHIVHGLCVGHAGGTTYAHAWVEADTAEHGMIVWQRGTMRATGADVFWALPREAFYELFGVQRDQLTRYRLEQAQQQIDQHGHLGPWREKYRELCHDTPGGRVLGSMSGVAPVAIVEVLAAVGGGGMGEF